MVLFIEILEGPLQGSRYKIVAGQRIGRNSGEIQIEDGKISSEHAKFDLDNKGQFILTDLDSSNGILASNRRVKKLAMMPGVVLRLGRTSFRVVQPEMSSHAAPADIVIKTWRENLSEKMPTDWIQNKMPEGAGKSFSPSLRLSFIQGIQADEDLILGYGPRMAGANSLDIDLLDADAPDQAFELLPEEGFAKIRNLCRNKLTVNNLSVDVEVLHDGDLIRIGSTVIKISYI